MANTTANGRFVWHELITPNRAGAQDFYSSTLGWRTEPWQQDPAYEMFAAERGPLGASVENREGTPQWLPYIATADVDATAEAAARLGGAVVTPPTELPNEGRYAVLTDPQGAAFGIHYSPAATAPEAPECGEFSWHELASTAGHEDVFPFYAELFGWEEISRHDMGPSGIYFIFGRDGQRLGGMFDKGEMGKPGAAYWMGYVRVADLDATVEKVKAARGAVLNGPMDVPGGDRIAQFADPHGAFFAAHWLAADAGAAAQAPAEQPAAQRKARTASKAASPASDEARPRTAAKKRAGKKVVTKKAVTKKASSKKASSKKAGAKKAGARKATARKAAPKKAVAKKAKKSAATKKRAAGKKAGKKKARNKTPRKVGKKGKSAARKSKRARRR